MVFCTEFLGGWWSWEPLHRSCVRCGCCRATTATSITHAGPMQRLSRPPPTQKLGAENHMLQLNIQCSWWWTYVPETCRAKNTLIKLPFYNMLAFQVVSFCTTSLAQRTKLIFWRSAVFSGCLRKPSEFQMQVYSYVLQKDECHHRLKEKAINNKIRNSIYIPHVGLPNFWGKQFPSKHLNS